MTLAADINFLSEYPDTIAIAPVKQVFARVFVPGSKSLTNRALLVSALADGKTKLSGCLRAEDSAVMVQALRTLGIRVDVEGATFTVHGQAGKIPANEASLDLKLSGTSMRFLTAMVALGQGKYTLDGTVRMRERPIGDLLTSLEQLGVHVKSEQVAGFPPLVVEAQGLLGGNATIAGDSSSQFLSALLMSAPYARESVNLEVTGVLQSKPFIDLTLDLMADFGVQVERQGYLQFSVPSGIYEARADYSIEGDATAAGYVWAAAAIAGGSATVANVGDTTRQQDKKLAAVLAQMGCNLTTTTTTTTIHAPKQPLKGGTFDLNAMPDQVQTLAVAALFADSPVHIVNVANLRLKETDRLSALATELQKLGAVVTEGNDNILIYPLKTPKLVSDVYIETYKDHRMAMAFALAGLRLEGLHIINPSCVAKTYPDYFSMLANLAPS